ncbi:methyltransferase [Marinobacteraceae bacterium S3BR75-40.1]
MSPTRLQERFEQLDQLLYEAQGLWRPAAFHHRVLPWEADYPKLAAWLAGLDDAEIEHFEEEPRGLRAALAEFCPILAEREPLLAFPTVPERELALERHFHHGIPGRKWAQIEAFLAAVEPSEQPTLEWCAGKGYLARTLAARDGMPVAGLEWHGELCRRGEREAADRGVDVTLHQQDVLAPEAARLLRRDGQVLALHACGDLHGRLLHLAADHRPRSIRLSPCCYQRTRDAHYRPFSRQARQGRLHLSRGDLHLAVQETVTGGRRVRRLRDREAAWRLGFDALQREVRGTNQYLNVPSLPKRLLGGSFRQFCDWAATQRGVALPGQLDWAAWEQHGVRRLRKVRRMELVAHAFRRPLEVWLVLDRALFLEQAGYRVRVLQFCERHLTPRNLLIDACREPARDA